MAETFAQGYALLIGVGQSAYAPWSLPVTVKDARAIRAVLVDPSLCAYPEDGRHVHLLHDEQATGEAILEGLDWLAREVATEPGATAIVYFSGHGWLEEPTGRYFLIPHDVEPHDIPGSAIPAEAFIEALRRVKAERLLAIVDACHAEGMATAKGGSAALKPPKGLVPAPPPKAIIDELKQGAGCAVFTSSRGDQKSWVRPDGTMSVYTYHLIEALQGASNRPGESAVKLSNLMNHLGRAVPDSARTLCHAEQVPFFDTAAEDFPVALLRGGKGLPGAGWPAVQEESRCHDRADRPGHRGASDRCRRRCLRQHLRLGRRESDQLRAHPGEPGSREARPRSHESRSRLVERDVVEPRRCGSGTEGSLPCLYPVWYGTNRRHADPSDPAAGYSADRESTDSVHYGRCLVSIPRSHRFGSVGLSWWRLWLTGTDDRLRVLERAELDRDAFWTALRDELARDDVDEQQALVYLHGYNVPFDEAAIRAAQIGFDLKVPARWRSSVGRRGGVWAVMPPTRPASRPASPQSPISWSDWRPTAGVPAST